MDRFAYRAAQENLLANGPELDDEFDRETEELMNNPRRGQLIPPYLIDIVPGKQANTHKFLCAGMTYYHDDRDINLIRCSRRKSHDCGGRIRFQPGGSGILVEVHRNHAPDKYVASEVAMKLFITRLVNQDSRLMPQQIWGKACVKYREAAENGFTENHCRELVYSLRRKSRPTLPATFEGLCPLLETYVRTENIYKGMVKSADGGVAHIFIGDEMLKHLSSARTLHMDGTFKVTPYLPRADQFFVIHLGRQTEGFAAVYVLMKRRTANLYVEVFRRLKAVVPSLSRNVKYVVTDFEGGLLSALSQEFPDAFRVGCEFHFLQAILRYWRQCGLASAPRDALWKAWALPKVPPELWIVAIDLIVDDLDKLPLNFANTWKFVRYLRHYWSKRGLPEIVAVMDAPVKTNNLAEAFNRSVLQRLGGTHPNIWIFFELLEEYITGTEVKLNATKNGVRVSRAQNQASKAEEERIKNLREKYHPLNRENLAAYLHEVTTPRRQNALMKAMAHVEREGDPLFFDVPDPADMRPFNAQMETAL